MKFEVCGIKDEECIETVNCKSEIVNKIITNITAIK